ncbi:hypothetical protein C8R46DRAFT_1348603 [Mycena filopes]|nr:hypothetical protein C8R46DRAFT_1348603 [Mycena filopes]
MPRPSKTQLEQARPFAQSVFEWELLAEEHSAVLRQNMNAYAAAYEQQLEARSEAPNAPNVLPPSEQWDQLIQDLNSSLTPKAVTIADRLKAVNACYFLCWLTMARTAQFGSVVELEMMRIKAALQNNHKYERIEMVLPPAHRDASLPRQAARDGRTTPCSNSTSLSNRVDSRFNDTSCARIHLRVH